MRRRWPLVAAALVVGIAVGVVLHARVAPLPPVASSAVFTTTTTTGTTGQRETVLTPPGAVTGLVVFMHGIGADDRQILADDQLFGVRDAILAAGYQVAASAAHGDNVGSAVSVGDQEALVERLAPGGGAVDVLAFSMGGLDALEAVGSAAVPQIHAVAMLSGVCDQVPYVGGQFQRQLLAAFPGPSSSLPARLATVDPAGLPATAFAGVRLHFWASPDDRTVSLSSQTRPCLQRLQLPETSALTLITGAHGDLRAVTPADVLALFSGR